jgi:hypothetical protein
VPRPGASVRQAGEFEAAVGEFRRAAAYDPRDARPLINLSYALDKLTATTGVAELQTAEKLDPNSRCCTELGQLTHQQEEIRRRARAARKAVGLDRGRVAYVSQAVASRDWNAWEAAETFGRASADRDATLLFNE